mgnify:CR=1 FL=1
MLRQQRDDYGQNKIIHTNGGKENLFIINRMILIQKKTLMTRPLFPGRVLLNRI